MTDLVEWLTSVWDEDEAAFAVACEAEAERCRSDGMPDYTAEEVKAYWQTLPSWAGWKFKLARIAADRCILRLHGGSMGGGAHECPDGFMDNDQTEPHCGYEVECLTLRFLASPYADRPGYWDEWRV